MSGQYVYFVSGGGLVKIGLAFNPLTRIGLLQVGSPVQLNLMAFAPGGRFAEAALHKKFSQHRRHGEWFSMSAELSEVIELAARQSVLPGWVLSGATQLRAEALLQIEPEKWALIELTAKRLGVGKEAIKKWKMRGSVPHKWRPQIIDQNFGTLSASDFQVRAAS